MKSNITLILIAAALVTACSAIVLSPSTSKSGSVNKDGLILRFSSRF